jgi:hypothetical protein
MTLRPYRKEDSETLAKMLRDEGTWPYEMRYADGGYETFVLEDDNKPVGFFTLTRVRKIYGLQHFCLGEGYRTIKEWRSIEKFLRYVLLEKKCPMVIMSAPRDNDRMKRMIELRYHKKPYQETKTTSFYNVNVLEVQ